MPVGVGLTHYGDIYAHMLNLNPFPVGDGLFHYGDGYAQLFKLFPLPAGAGISIASWCRTHSLERCVCKTLKTYSSATELWTNSLRRYLFTAVKNYSNASESLTSSLWSNLFNNCYNVLQCQWELDFLYYGYICSQLLKHTPVSVGD
jgi:hypothetical protein